jgi:hypothetical protein
LGDAGLTLVNGSGLLVGSAAVSGFLSALQQTGSWDLDRRLIARPFPQPLHGKEPNREQWAMLRAELGRLSGVVIFIGGQKVVGGRIVEADGVYAEQKVAIENGSFLLPIGATGGASKRIGESLMAAPKEPKAQARRPSNKELAALLDESKSSSELVALATKIVKRVAGV